MDAPPIHLAFSKPCDHRTVIALNRIWERVPNIRQMVGSLGANLRPLAPIPCQFMAETTQVCNLGAGSLNGIRIPMPARGSIASRHLLSRAACLEEKVDRIHLR